MQEDGHKRAGCEEIYTDVASGVKTAQPGLDEALRTTGVTIKIVNITCVNFPFSDSLDIPANNALTSAAFL
jgi:hypothetical protein